MRTIALANQKGGVGKTTTTVNLGAALTLRGNNVALLDMDPQAHLTTFLGIAPENTKYNCYDLLTEAVPLKNALIKSRDNLSVLASGLELAAAEQELVSVVGRETILRDAIADNGQGNFDYVLLDCPPSLGLLTLNSLAAVNEVFITIEPHFLSLQGLSQLLETVTLVQRRINPALKVTGLVFCMYDARASLTTEIVGDIKSFFGHQNTTNCPWSNIRIFQTVIRRNIKLAESPSYGQTIFEYENNCHGAEDYRALAEEVEQMTKENKPQKTTKNDDTATKTDSKTSENIQKTTPTMTIIASEEPKKNSRPKSTVDG